MTKNYNTSQPENVVLSLRRLASVNPESPTITKTVRTLISPRGVAKLLETWLSVVGVRAISDAAAAFLEPRAKNKRLSLPQSAFAETEVDTIDAAFSCVCEHLLAVRVRVFLPGILGNPLFTVPGRHRLAARAFAVATGIEPVSELAKAWERVGGAALLADPGVYVRVADAVYAQGVDHEEAFQQLSPKRLVERSRRSNHQAGKSARRRHEYSTVGASVLRLPYDAKADSFLQLQRPSEYYRFRLIDEICERVKTTVRDLVHLSSVQRSGMVAPSPERDATAALRRFVRHSELLHALEQEALHEEEHEDLHDLSLATQFWQASPADSIYADYEDWKKNNKCLDAEKRLEAAEDGWKSKRRAAAADWIRALTPTGAEPPSTFRDAIDALEATLTIDAVGGMP